MLRAVLAMIQRKDIGILILLFIQSGSSISNEGFNEHIRNYGLDDHSNSTNIKTLQKDATRYTSFSPLRSRVSFKDYQNKLKEMREAIKSYDKENVEHLERINESEFPCFQEASDNALSSTSHSRGLHHEHSGYALNDYEETPYVHSFEYNVPDHPQPFDHKYHGHDPHHYPPYHLDHGYRYKPYNHPLAAKTLLWPIAGIALLGAAAALVTNPVLLQLGVVSGRKRRDTDEINNSELIEKLRNNPTLIKKEVEKNKEIGKTEDFKQMSTWKAFMAVKHPDKSTTKSNKRILQTYKRSGEDDNFIPIPLILKQ